MIEVNNTVKTPINKEWVKKIIKKALSRIKGRKLKDISIALVEDKTIRKLNRVYRGIDKITDILSFEEINEIIICYPQAKKQAKEKKHSVKKELEILLIHGVLHLLGYDHKTKRDDSIMRRLEEKLLIVDC